MRELIQEIQNLQEDWGIGIDVLLMQYAYNQLGLNPDQLKHRVNSIIGFYQKQLENNKGNAKKAHSATEKWINKTFTYGRRTDESAEEDIQNLIDIQVNDPAVEEEPYFAGLANGLMLGKSCIDGKEPKFVDCPKNKVDEITMSDYQMHSFWVLSNGKTVDVPEHTEHVEAIIKNPSLFGVAKVDPLKISRYLGDNFNSLSTSVMKKGAIAITVLARKEEVNLTSDRMTREGLQRVLKYLPFTPKMVWWDSIDNDGFYGTIQDFYQKVKENIQENNAEHKYSCAMVNMPKEIAEAIINFALTIPDKELYEDITDPTYGRELESHITVLYGLTDENPDSIEKVLKKFKGPIRGKLGKISLFSRPEKFFDVVKIDVDCPQLIELHDLLKTLDNKETFPKYIPHLTIAYVKKGEGKKYEGKTDFDGLRFEVDKVQFKGSTDIDKEIELKDEMNESFVLNLNNYHTPLGSSMANAYKALLDYQLGGESERTGKLLKDRVYSVLKLIKAFLNKPEITKLEQKDKVLMVSLPDIREDIELALNKIDVSTPNQIAVNLSQIKQELHGQIGSHPELNILLGNVFNEFNSLSRLDSLVDECKLNEITDNTNGFYSFWMLPNGEKIDVPNGKTHTEITNFYTKKLGKDNNPVRVAKGAVPVTYVLSTKEVDLDSDEFSREILAKVLKYIPFEPEKIYWSNRAKALPRTGSLHDIRKNLV